jgi:hypothetical protein
MELRAWEANVRDMVVRMLEGEADYERRQGAEPGSYSVTLAGQPPETELVVEGPGQKTGKPCRWLFGLYDSRLVGDWGCDPVDLATGIVSNLDD